MPSAPPLLGATVGGRYRVIQLLASGGAGDVYLAESIAEPGSGRVALKVLRAEHRRRVDLVQRFRREADAIACVRHPNVLALVDARGLRPGEPGYAPEPPVEPPGSEDGALYYVMELLVGLDLADTLAYSRTLGSPRAVRIACGAAAGLGAAHEAGVIHRDVKPENIFLVHAADGSEAVKLLDFGFAWMRGDDGETGARVSTPGTVVGTPEYMAPEQARGEPASPAADVYALGIVLYEMLAGSVPFTGSYPAIARRHAEDPPPSIRAYNPAAVLSAELEAIVARALAKHPHERFASMAELRRALAATPEAASLGLPC
jgi:serine/threonine-protein kinase